MRENVTRRCFDARWNIDATNMHQQVVAVALCGRDRVEIVDPFDVYVYARHGSSIEWIDVSALRTASVSWTPRRGMATGAPFVTTPYAGLPPGVVLRCDPWP